MSKKRAGGKIALIVVGCIVVALVGAAVFLKMPGPSAAAQIEPFTKQPIAHRGYFDNDSTAPENSLAAFQRAIDHGYAIELDTQISADGEGQSLINRIALTGMFTNVVALNT